jgi:hypothetical protein
VLILAFDLTWIYYYRLQTEPLDVRTFLMSERLWPVWIVTGILAIGAILHRSRQRLMLRNLLDLRSQLDDVRAERDPS